MTSAAMNPVAAVLFIIAGLGLYRSAKNSTLSQINKDPVAFWCGAALIALPAEKVLEHVLGFGPFIDQLLFASKVHAQQSWGANVLAPNAVLNFFFCGSALLFIDAESKKGIRPAQSFILAVGLIALLALVGYTYDVLALYRVGTAAPMALLTALAFLIWCAGALAARPAHGVMSVITSNTTGGAVARRLLPMAILIPWVLGVLRWAGECMGYYETQVGIAMFTVATIVIFSTLVWWNARLLHNTDLERIAFEDRLRRASANLERSNTELQQFAYVASHDLFEPLRMITSYLQILAQTHKDQLDARGKEFIGYALDGAERMRALINDLLAYSRVDARGQPFKRVDCNAIVDTALLNLKIAIEESHATVERGSLPEIDGDTVQLTQVFQNLIGNAIKFRGTEPPVVCVGAQKQDGEWLFSISDNGIGISPEHFQRVFEIFQRLHTRREYPGTGMGLAICKKIIERHGGRIWVESAPQKGSTFKFTVPAK